VEDDTDFALAQFQSLRSEILVLIQLQSQLVTLNVVALGTLLSIGAQSKTAEIIFVYPLLSLILGLLWLNHAHGIIRVAGFVAWMENDRIQEKVRWENYMNDRKLILFDRIGHWAVRAIFPVGSVLSLVVCLLIGIRGTASWIAFGGSAAISVLTAAIFVFLSENRQKEVQQVALTELTNDSSQVTALTGDRGQ